MTQPTLQQAQKFVGTRLQVYWPESWCDNPARQYTAAWYAAVVTQVREDEGRLYFLVQYEDTDCEELYFEELTSQVPRGQ